MVLTNAVCIHGGYSRQSNVTFTVQKVVTLLLLSKTKQRYFNCPEQFQQAYDKPCLPRFQWLHVFSWFKDSFPIQCDLWSNQFCNVGTCSIPPCHSTSYNTGDKEMCNCMGTDIVTCLTELTCIQRIFFLAVQAETAFQNLFQKRKFQTQHTGKKHGSS